MSAQAVVERIEVPTELAQQMHPVTNLTPMQMAYQLIQNGADLGSVKEMLAMSRELAAEEAKRAFDAAMSAAKAEIPVISKNRRVGFEHKNGEGETNYSHEDLGQIARTVDPILSKHGLSYRYRSQQGEGRVTITCILSHRDGHFEETVLSAAPDASGKKNAIQQTGSAITYMQRYTLKLALGLAAASDDDGAASSQPDLISEKQALDLNDLINSVVEEISGNRPAFVKSFLKFMKAERVEDISAKDYQKAVNAINASRGAR